MAQAALAQPEAPSVAQSVSPTPSRAAQAPGRLTSLDAYRGFVMFLMMAEVLRLSRMAANFPQSSFWKFLAHHQSHVEWAGCSLHDLIQPAFSFLVGVVLPFSIASRRGRGATFGVLARHAAIRALILIILGIIMASLYVIPWRVNLEFDDTLAQIGLAYGFLFPLGFCRPRTWWIALAVVLF